MNDLLDDHPYSEVTTLLSAAGVEILLTDTSEQDDSIVMTSDCRNYEFDVLRWRE
jgi:hypothetical protein